MSPCSVKNFRPRHSSCRLRASLLRLPLRSTQSWARFRDHQSSACQRNPSPLSPRRQSRQAKHNVWRQLSVCTRPPLSIGRSVPVQQTPQSTRPPACRLRPTLAWWRNSRRRCVSRECNNRPILQLLVHRQHIRSPGQLNPIFRPCPPLVPRLHFPASQPQHAQGRTPRSPTSRTVNLPRLAASRNRSPGLLGFGPPVESWPTPYARRRFPLLGPRQRRRLPRSSFPRRRGLRRPTTKRRHPRPPPKSSLLLPASPCQGNTSALCARTGSKLASRS